MKTIWDKHVKPKPTKPNDCFLCKNEDGCRILKYYLKGESTPEFSNEYGCLICSQFKLDKKKKKNKDDNILVEVQSTFTWMK